MGVLSLFFTVLVSIQFPLLALLLECDAITCLSLVRR
jgi:hypothetical protein